MGSSLDFALRQATKAVPVRILSRNPFDLSRHEGLFSGRYQDDEVGAGARIFREKVQAMNGEPQGKGRTVWQ